jgi:hypothetical protein
MLFSRHDVAAEAACMSMLLEGLDGRAAQSGRRRFVLRRALVDQAALAILECRSAETDSWLGFRPFDATRFEALLTAILGDSGLYSEPLLGAAYERIYDGTEHVE